MGNILVTGGAGYIGYHVVKDLANRGHNVRVFDKLLFGSEGMDSLKGWASIIQGDIRQIEPGALEDITSVVHLAGFSNDPMANTYPKANDEINRAGTERLARLCAEKGINRFTYGSSASIYDTGTSGVDVLQTEESPVQPRNHYSLSKYKGEVALLDLMKEFPDFQPVILRQGTVYGHSPRMRFDLVVNTFVREALLRGKLPVNCGGTQWRPLVDVRDVARAHTESLLAPGEKVQGQTFNVVQGNYQVWDVAHRVVDALKDLPKEAFSQGAPRVDINYGDDRIDRSYKISGEKIENTLGFKYLHTISDSAADMARRAIKGEYGYFPQGLDDSKHKNIVWVDHLIDIERRIKEMGGSVF
jgi:nucleoside-diphosphate-sugar epimerase